MRPVSGDVAHDFDFPSHEAEDVVVFRLNACPAYVGLSVPSDHHGSPVARTCLITERHFALNTAAAIFFRVTT